MSSGRGGDVYFLNRSLVSSQEVRVAEVIRARQTPESRYYGHIPIYYTYCDVAVEELLSFSDFILFFDQFLFGRRDFFLLIALICNYIHCERIVECVGVKMCVGCYYCSS